MPESLQDRVDAVPYWYHRIELPGRVITPGWAPINSDAYRVPSDLTGLRVLDVGAWDGYWSFEALRRGAREVLAIEDFSDHIAPQEEAPRNWDTFDLCREAFGFSPETCRREELSLYDLTPERHGMFDVVFFFGTLYHCRYPLLALDTLSAVCKTAIYIESATCNRCSGYNEADGYNQRDVVAQFFSKGAFGQPTNWWMPTIECMALMVQAAGWPNSEAWELTETPANIPECRGFAVGYKDREPTDTTRPAFVKLTPVPLESIFDAVKRLVPDATQIIDCGASVGDTVWEFRSRYPDAQIDAIEPEATAFQTLTSRYADDPLCRTRCAAVGDYVGEVTLNITAGPQSHTILNALPGNPCEKWTRVVRRQEHVAMQKLDLVAANADILKLDIQGAEVMALRGGRELLKLVKAVIIEIMFTRLYQDCPLARDIDQFMREHGFRLVKVYPSNQPENWADALYVKGG